MKEIILIYCALRWLLRWKDFTNNHASREKDELVRKTGNAILVYLDNKVIHECTSCH